METGQELEDCEKMEVQPQWLNELCSRIVGVLQWNHNAESLLPTQSGFFFSTDYYEYYYQDLLLVFRDCVELLVDLDKDEKITYSAWW